MLPIELLAIVLCVFAVSVPVFKYGLPLLVDKLAKKHKKKKNLKKIYDRYDKKKVMKSRKKNEGKNRLDLAQEVTFQDLKSKEAKKINAVVKTACDFEKDKIFRGKLKVHTSSGSVTEDDIYLYQPRMYSTSGVCLGPKYSKNGNLSDKNTYLAKNPTTGSIMNTYIPKREVVSGLEYDFVKKSVNSRTDDISKFIEIEIPQDEFGNFIPVDLLNNQAEIERFRNYVTYFQENMQDPFEYFKARIEYAGAALEKYYEQTKPEYARPAAVQTTETVQKVESSRKSNYDPNSFYARYNRYILPYRAPFNRHNRPMYGHHHHHHDGPGR